jgi:hypothetical protein
MKIRIVSSKDEISTLDSNEQMVHLAFRPSNKDIFSLVNTCPGLKALHIPSSYKKTVFQVYWNVPGNAKYPAYGRRCMGTPQGY